MNQQTDNNLTMFMAELTDSNYYNNGQNTMHNLER
jgi:hypothetical protein